MKYRLLRHALGIASVVLALGVTTCGDNGEDKQSEESEPLPCDSTPNFDDLADGEYEWFGELCAEAGIDIAVLEFQYSADRKRFRLRGSYSSDDPPHYIFADDAAGSTCYITLNGGKFEVAREFEHCTDIVSLNVMASPPPTFQGSFETHDVVCPFSVRMLPFPSDCEEQPANEED